MGPSNNSSLVEIHPVTPSSFQPSVTVLARAFVSDPVSIAAYPKRSPAGRIAALSVDFKAELRVCLRKGYPLVASNGQGVLGAAVIYPPGRYPLSLLDQWYLFLSSFLGNGLYDIRGWMHWLDEVEKHHPPQPYYYLEYLAVAPQHQGMGVGSALLRHLVDIADDHRVGCYLENANPRNTPLYQRFGFQVQAEQVIIGIPTWFMWRPPL